MCVCVCVRARVCTCLRVHLYVLTSIFFSEGMEPYWDNVAPYIYPNGSAIIMWRGTLSESVGCEALGTAERWDTGPFLANANTPLFPPNTDFPVPAEPCLSDPLYKKYVECTCARACVRVCVIHTHICIHIFPGHVLVAYLIVCLRLTARCSDGCGTSMLRYPKAVCAGECRRSSHLAVPFHRVLSRTAPQRLRPRLPVGWEARLQQGRVALDAVEKYCVQHADRICGRQR